ncbi:MAG: phosphoenolpyruvate--protein phosphotransferase [Deltaproteobacteria bacterium]|nr:phosphoenolpyruvate--protein phosphotransferase [Deltaproteobacteria bacterium]
MAEAAEIRQRAHQRAGHRHGLQLLEAIGNIITQSHDLRASAQGVVATVAEHLGMEVCSIYAYNRERNALTLWATTGLDPASVGRVTMGVDEGLTGIVVQKLEPVMAIDALVHPRYKYFPETGEERYHSFLGVPVVDRGQPVGVLIVQTSRRRRFTVAEVRLLKNIAVSVAAILAQLQLQASLATKEEERRAIEERMAAMSRSQEPEPALLRGQRGPVRLMGLGASPGYGIGRAHLVTPDVSFSGLAKERRQPLKRELARLKKAVQRADDELVRTKSRILASVPEIDAAIFDAQWLMLQDPSFEARIEAAVREGLSAEAALEEAVEGLVRHFAELDDAYFKDRASDIKDIGQRVLRHLLGIGERTRQFATSVVLVARDVTLSDLTIVEQEGLNGVVLASGGVTSHASILARSLEIPTVAGLERADEIIHEGDHLIVDGNAGVVFVNPTPEVVREYERLTTEYRAFNRDLELLRDLPAETPDGHHVCLSANIGLLGDLHVARLHGAETIGLYRTEVAFLSHRDFLSEEEQVDLYKRVVTGMGGRPVTIRTLDLGADKYPRYLNVPHEENPFLGWRSIRISLEMPELFKEQLRAILRASAHGPVRIMFPMISSLEEIRRAKELLGEAQEEVSAAGHEFDAQMAVGMMIEVPSAVSLAVHLIQEADFFSIGTNDLIQYVLAVDRNNRKVGSLYEPLHPAVIQSVMHIVDTARRAGKRVSLCGEMAADPMCALLLVGMGLDDLSMSAFFIPLIKRLVRSVPYSVARQMAEDVLRLATVKEIKGHVFQVMRDLGMIDIMEMYH